MKKCAPLHFSAPVPLALRPAPIARRRPAVGAAPGPARCCVDPTGFDPYMDEGVEPSPMQELVLAQARRLAETLPAEVLVEALAESYRDNLRLRNWILRSVSPGSYAEWRRSLEAAPPRPPLSP